MLHFPMPDAEEPADLVNDLPPRDAIPAKAGRKAAGRFRCQIRANTISACWRNISSQVQRSRGSNEPSKGPSADRPAPGCDPGHPAGIPQTQYTLQINLTQHGDSPRPTNRYAYMPDGDATRTRPACRGPTWDQVSDRADRRPARLVVADICTCVGRADTAIITGLSTVLSP